MSRSARLATLGVAALLAAAAASPWTALAFDKVDHLNPVQAGRGYVYYIREVDAQKRPLAGRTVSASVGAVPGPGASVAPADAGGHVTGPAGQTASQQSGTDGMVYFLLRTSTTPGQNQFTWTDVAYSGEVLVTGTPAPAGVPPKPAPVAAGGTHGATGGSSRGGGGHGVAPIIPAAGAAVLAWAAAAILLLRRRRQEPVPLPSLSDRLPNIG